MRHALAAMFALGLMTACAETGTSGGDVAAPGEAAVSVTPRGGSFQSQAVAKLGAIRQSVGQGLGTPRFSTSLAAAAEAHARDMVTAGFRSHQGSDGSSFRTRAERAGNSCALAENITWGASTVDGAFDWWLSSPPHRAAMLRPDISTFGLAEVNRVWVLVLGRC